MAGSYWARTTANLIGVDIITEGKPADVYGDDIASVLISEDQIAEKIDELAALVAKRYPADSPEGICCWWVCSRAPSSS